MKIQHHCLIYMKKCVISIAMSFSSLLFLIFFFFFFFFFSLLFFSQLAEGSFGVVYKGIYHRTNETVALKIISLEEGESFDDL
jgi:hypothetical protein